MNPAEASNSFWTDNPENYPKHLQSDQFVTVWRGLQHWQRPPKIDYDNLGVHWVEGDKNHWAQHFATTHLDSNWNDEDNNTTGTVIKARVPVTGLPKDEEEHDYLSNIGEGAYDLEGETPIRPGTEVHVVGIERHTPEGSRAFVFKNPRVGRS